jgi:hypothetical protein
MSIGHSEVDAIFSIGNTTELIPQEHSEVDAIRRIQNTNTSSVLFAAVGLGLLATDEVSTFRDGGRLI